MRQYVSPAELNEDPFGIALAPQIAQLATGVLDKLLGKASASVDGECLRRMGSPGITAVGTGGIASGATLLPLQSTLGIDQLAEQAALIGSGSSHELIPIVAGSVNVTASPFAAPYAGTVTLASPVANAHLFNETVQIVYYEVSTAGSSSSSDIYSEAYTQQAEIAMAHAPMLARGANLTRIVMLKQYPIQSVSNVEHAYPFSSGFVTLGTSGLNINAAEGWIQLPLGSVVIPDGLVRTTYIAGYNTVPDDIKEATMYYFAAHMVAFFNAMGAHMVATGKHRVQYASTNGQGDLYWIAQAKAKLKRYKRTV